MIEQEKPEVVILAIGADTAACPAAGITMSVVCDAWQILNGEVTPKDNAVVIGGDLVGMETANFLREKGVQNITLIEMLAKPSVRPISTHGTMLHRRLPGLEVSLIFNAMVKEIEEGAVIVSTEGVEKRLEPVDQVIVAVGVTPKQDFKEMLARRKIRHFIVGDAKEPRRIIEATTEGAQAAWDI